MTETAGSSPKLKEISSVIADLPVVVQKFWSAVAEPLFELSISLLVLFFALGGDNKVENAVSAQLIAIPKMTPDDTYGIKALVPIAVLILLIGIAQGNSKLLRVIGMAIPGRLVQDRTMLLIHGAKLNGSLLELGEAWQYNPRLGDVWELNAEIDTTIGRVPLDPAKDILYKAREMQSRSDLLASTAAFVKGLLVVTIAVDVVLFVFKSWPLHWGNLAVIVAVAAAALLYLAFGRIQAEREYAQRKVRDYNFHRKLSGAQPAEQDERRLALLDGPPTRRSAWTLTLVPHESRADIDTLLRALVARPE
ncbi:MULTISPECIES: hypothetical protein [unclassified Bradyrhizobium]|uniref:hypothetical protein n=1 Tax=unclassified Bradyrhizobium TaxID=2631580 RepID=UPI0029167C28|nr:MULTISPECIES: hypothetical protein [unclassified Bradyrhizobium]